MLSKLIQLTQQNYFYSGSNPSIDLLTEGAAAAAAAGSAEAQQAVIELATGGNANVFSANGIDALVTQNVDVSQVHTASVNGAASTGQFVDAANAALGDDFLVAALNADQQVVVQDSAATNAQGTGTAAVAGGTSNVVQSGHR